MTSSRLRFASTEEVGRRFFRRPAWCVVSALVAFGCLGSLGLGQENKAEPKAPAASQPPPAPAKEVPKQAPKESTAPEPKEELPAPVDIKGNDLLTSDGVALKATFYPSTRGKEAVPVILLHSSKGDRKEYAALAPFLQKLGHAVLVPDLRGFGESKQMIVGGRAKDFDASKTRLMPADYQAMVYEDMEALKKFLVRENNQGHLNVNKLCVIGAEMGASVALHWARHDWSWPVLGGGLKQGQDVKALVLISPRWSFPGLPAHDALSHPAVRTELSLLIVVGRGEPDAVAQARRLYKLVKRDQSDLPPEKKDLFFGELETKLQGTKMLGVPGLNLEAFIAQFIERRLVKQDYPWIKR